MSSAQSLGSAWGQLTAIVQRLRGGEGPLPVADTPKEVLRALDARLEGPKIDAEQWAAVGWGEAEILDPATAAGHATDPEAYAHDYARVFAALDQLEGRLAEQRYYLGGPQPTVADWWVLCLLLRFEAVYYRLYKCNRTRLQDFEHLPNYVRDLVQSADIEPTIDRDAIKIHHYTNEPVIHPKGILPRGQGLDLRAPHDRALRFGAERLGAVGTEEDQRRRRKAGEWVRPRSAHREVITADGSSGFAAEPGRYHLYVALNCPWCHRVVLARELLGLQETISMDVLFYRRDPERGWQFRPQEPGCTEDTIFGHRFIRELYERAGSTEKSVPVLYDRRTDTIVNNESAQIVRMLGQAFGAHATRPLELYPAEHRDEIDRINAWVYTEINNGAYKAGFASSQQAYSSAYDRLFAAFDRLDERLGERRFLVGDSPTEADLRLFPTIFRFDHVYYTRFGLDHKMVRDYRSLRRWHADMLAWPGVAAASNLEHCRRGYFGRTGNNIVPLGPKLDG